MILYYEYDKWIKTGFYGLTMDVFTGSMVEFRYNLKVCFKVLIQHVTGVLMAIERYTSVWMATYLMQRQCGVKKKLMSPVLIQHLIHARGKVMVYMQTTAPTAKITIGIQS